MSSTITSIVALIVGVIMAQLSGMEFFQSNPDLTQAIPALLTAVFSLAFSFLLKFVAGKEKWENFFRVAAMVVNLVRAEAEAGTSNAELRQRAVSLILTQIPESNLGWRGWFLKIPGFGPWIIGWLLDQVVSGYRRLALEPPEATMEQLKNSLWKAKLASNRKN